ncbi:MAG: hypothetical protein KF836_01915 [Fimbriimonadaceae bacterium]|nr:hypothetical protein [Fimbriimonadaceae bacterium]
MKSSKLFLMAIAVVALGAFALVGCEPAAEPAPETGTTGSNTATPETATTTPEGGETKTTEGGDMTGGEAKTTEGTEGTEPAATPEGGDAKPADDGHGHAAGEGH